MCKKFNSNGKCVTCGLRFQSFRSLTKFSVGKIPKAKVVKLPSFKAGGIVKMRGRKANFIIIDDPLTETISKKVMEKIRKDLGEISFEREFLCEPVSEEFDEQSTSRLK